MPASATPVPMNTNVHLEDFLSFNPHIATRFTYPRISLVHIFSCLWNMSDTPYTLSATCFCCCHIHPGHYTRTFYLISLHFIAYTWIYFCHTAIIRYHTLPPCNCFDTLHALSSLFNCILLAIIMYTLLPIQFCLSCQCCMHNCFGHWSNISIALVLLNDYAMLLYTNKSRMV
jgi:hypothetical protein